MDHFDDSPIIKTLRSAYFGNDDAQPHEVFSDYRICFSAMPPLTRRSELNAIDNHLEQHGTKPTRELAATISMRRSLADLDALLRRSGR
jgi:hypothetical protein